MLFKLSIKNMKKSMQDYAIYFMTLILGVAIFYVFNSIDSQKAMMDISASTEDIVDLLLTMLNGVSVFVSFILGFLIIYANNFLIKRRKKEFAVYMSLGMGRGSISKILVIETLIIGIISLGIGLVIGIFSSQFMSIFVAKMFEADMNAYTFIFSSQAAVKTIIYFGIMYLMVLLFNTISISRYKLIDLLTAVKRTEQVKMKNPVTAVIVFIISIGLLGFAYYNVTVGYLDLTESKLIVMISIGCISTFLFFWSLSGFLLKVLQKKKIFCLKNLNSFVLRQMNSKINTTVFSMTIICLMLFVTICVLSTGVSLNNSFTDQLKESTPKDFAAISMMDGYKKTNGNDKTVIEGLKENGFDMSLFCSDYVEANTYGSEKLTGKETLGSKKKELNHQLPRFKWNMKEEFMGINEYNKMAKLLGLETYQLKKDEYMIVSTFEPITKIRNMVLKEGSKITLNGTTYSPKYKKCKEGYLNMAQSRTNFGILLFPDEAIEKYKNKIWQYNYFTADYKEASAVGKEKTEEKLNQFLEKSGKNMEYCITYSKIALYESSLGLSSIVTFVAIYLGIIFLISSAALLALKELSDSTDNKERYDILRKIGTDEHIINKALFSQIGIFFIMPLLLAVVHSIFGIIFANKMLVAAGSVSLLSPILTTAAVILFVYGGYFLATYLESKKIIKG